MNIGWVLTIILLVFLLMVLASCVKIVPQAQAMVVERLGGYLATCSCSHFAEEERFTAMLSEAARDAAVQDFDTRDKG